MASWTDTEVYQLIDLWSDSDIQSQLEGCKKNRDVYEKIAKKLHDAGFNRNAVQCRDKIKKLKGEYRKIKDHNNETGNNRKQWRFYDTMNKVLETRPASMPPVMIDTSISDDNQQDSQDRGDDADDSDKESNTSMINKVSMETANQEEEGRGRRETSTTDEIVDTESEKGSEKPLQKRKRKENVKKDKVERVLDKFCEAIGKNQLESDKLFAELEEKRMKLDMQMMEMERERRKEETERLEQRRREEREFQMQLFTMMFQGNSRNSQYTSGLSSFSASQPYYSPCQTDGFWQGYGPSKTSEQ